MNTNIWAGDAPRAISSGFDIVYIRDRIMEDDKIINPIKSSTDYTNNIETYNTSRDAFLKELINGTHILQTYEHAKLAYEKASRDKYRNESKLSDLRDQYRGIFRKTGADKTGALERTIEIDKQARADWIETEKERLFPQTQQAPTGIEGTEGTERTEAKEPGKPEGTGGSRIRRTRRIKRTNKSKRSKRTRR